MPRRVAGPVAWLNGSLHHELHGHEDIAGLLESVDKGVKLERLPTAGADQIP
ncbi:hypothetical protein OG830_34110 [Streptomyces sp. NBC_00121]|uniref:hypothetical protein n=1 Tax=unclassified Streptomyces TaxID=2593676 RepID=UPI002DD82ACA|nr:hypothetical protein [Streptomyces sp. NBC_01760]WSC73229.1 hypothetical protein OG807_34775 [Streptomyces sp. NBC_01760]